MIHTLRNLKITVKSIGNEALGRQNRNVGLQCCSTGVIYVFIRDTTVLSKAVCKGKLIDAETHQLGGGGGITF